MRAGAEAVAADRIDTAVVRRAATGDRTAFETLYELYARTVHGVLLARVPFGDVDDLLQDVFMTALQRLELLRAPEAFGGWLCSIARRRAIDFLRARRKLTEIRENHASTGPARAEAIGVLETIGGLPIAYRETLLLRLVEGMTGPEIAERTGLTPDSVRVNLYRGMQMLRERLGGNKQ